MPTYYEILQIPPTATVSEIETACEKQYNHWRRLVTHHDPNMVNKANQALQWLEKMRATLTDPAKREEYDASIGLRGPVGGLADPQARPRVAVPTPPPPRPRPGIQSPLAPAVTKRVDVWICPKCQTPNAISTRFCRQCGHTLGRECPSCSSLIEAVASHCTHCGANVEQLIQQREWEEETQRRQQQQREVEAARAAQLEHRRSAWARRLGFGTEANRAVPVVVGAFIGLITSAIFVQGKMTDLQNVYVQATETVGSAAPIVGLIIGGILGAWIASDAEDSFSIIGVGVTAVMGTIGGVAQALVLYLLVSIVDKGIGYAILSIVIVVPAIALIASMFSVVITSVLAGLVWGVTFGIVRLGLWGVAWIGRTRAGN